MAWQPNKKDTADVESPKVTKIDTRTWKMWMVLPYHERPLSGSDKELEGSGRLSTVAVWHHLPGGRPAKMRTRTLMLRC
jgi:hypothetical protein